MLGKVSLEAEACGFAASRRRTLAGDVYLWSVGAERPAFWVSCAALGDLYTYNCDRVWRVVYYEVRAHVVSCPAVVC